ncbi:Decaprenylphosphoryl-beta-D-ribose oxidase [BD1-7 clade bacterium]|uniref:Decaprenylphosphoryl-beta-D-ribose oxidase n=1 Tax=BD1-7 clade bacterium TaxID=2029982 RepID=A0A5S9Q795_9GAMM|nr:Decaprenylphosphoryl-beta-D-ribose oxidase [BD1-7 clade bacterium]CAA0114356.1 Decaprenylphosphoryl-beta-D-ribose oxidase [BD1-7 clade bacterium]
MSKQYSWGRYPAVQQRPVRLASRHSRLPSTEPFLPYGLGRSYGDSCLCSHGHLLSSQSLDQFIQFDPKTGVLRCEAGVTLAEIIEVCLPHGWFLPVTPGTKYVTVGGAIGNDVHGKNHHSAGSFGNHVQAFELLRSDGSRLLCTESSNSEYFRATLGGLGLTGMITWAELQLKSVTSRSLDVESIKYSRLSDFFSLSDETTDDWEYTVAWLDCTAKGNELGRGHFIRGKHAESDSTRGLVPGMSIEHGSKLTFPVESPISLINNLSVQAFNTLYYQRQRANIIRSQQDYDPFFYPLDGILHWNRMYGKQGFLQHQCVIPVDTAADAVEEMLKRISRAGMGSFLVVLKMMGAVASKGMMSFPMEGATLAMDFPFQGNKTLSFLDSLDKIVHEAGGRLYPAKDARMSADMFRSGFPAWQDVDALRDPAITSDFWQRVAG